MSGFKQSEIEIPFSTDDELPSPVLELDTDYNYLTYGCDKSIFDYTEVAYLRLLPPARYRAYALDISDGLIELHKADAKYQFEETIHFTKTSKAELKYYPNGSVITEWVAGKDLPVTVDKRIVKVSGGQETIGSLKCTYEVYYDRIKVRWDGEIPTDPTNVIALADFRTDDQIAEQSQGYADSVTDVVTAEVEFANKGYRDVEIIFKDIGTDQPIEGADVTLNKYDGAGQPVESQNGTTDENGKVTFTQLRVGDEYRLVSTKTGYVDSATDYLKNDAFIVPEIEE